MIKCPHCKADLKAMHEAAKEHDGQKVYAICVECGAPVVRMAYGFRKPTDKEMTELNENGLADIQAAFFTHKAMPPDESIRQAWLAASKTLVDEWHRAAFGKPLSVGMATVFELMFYFGAKAAKDAVKKVITSVARSSVTAGK